MHLYVGACVSEACLQFPRGGERARDVSILTGKRPVTVSSFENMREFSNYEKSQEGRKKSEGLVYRLDSLREFHTKSCSTDNGYITLRDPSEKYSLTCVTIPVSLPERNRQRPLCLLESLSVRDLTLLKV